MLADLPTIAATAGVIGGMAVAAVELFRRGRRLYDIELGGVEIKLREAGESAARLDAASQDPERVERELARVTEEVDRRLARLAEEADHQSLSLVNAVVDDAANRLAAIVRAEAASATQAAAERSERIVADEYHAQGLAQSKIAFLFSIVFAALGFLLIAASVIAVLAGAQVGTGVISLISGSVVEAVSALFFVQANRARNLMVQFFDRLRVDRSLDESLNLAQSITDPLIRSRLQTLLAVRLAQATATDEVLRTVMAATATESVQVASPEAEADART
jgi:hypothetical protein